MEESSRTQGTNDANPNSAEKDQVAGDLDQAKGRVKESAGAFTGDEHLKAQGEADQMTGAARTKKGQWKERIKSWIDRL
jgi:uncharacterized protein YjbJ (UPF0337 family)